MASSSVATGVGISEDVVDGDTGTDGEGDGELLDDSAMADLLGVWASSRRGTLLGCLRPVIFFLIFTNKIGDWRLQIHHKHA